MIYTQPVVYELSGLHMPVLLVIGDKDTTAIGKNFAPATVQATLGNYPVLGKAAAAQMPHSKLVEFPDLGHAPQIQGPEAFHAAVLDFLRHPESSERLTQQGGIRIRRPLDGSLLQAHPPVCFASERAAGRRSIGFGELS